MKLFPSLEAGSATSSTRIFGGGMLLSLLVTTACTSSSAPAPQGGPAATPPSATTPSSAERQAAEERQAVAERRARAATQRQQQLAAAQAAAEAGKWEELAAALPVLREALSAADQGEDLADFSAALDELTQKLAAGQAAAAEQARAARLDQARQWTAAGRLDDAQQALRDVLTRAPSDEQRETAQTLTQEIERIRKARRQLKSWLSLLASAEMREVQTAQTQLLQDPDTASGMILEALRGTDKPALAAVYLDTLRQIGKSEVVVPVLLELLRDPQQQVLAPLITEYLPQLAGPEAAPALLDLAVQATDEKQRLSALVALATSTPPPASALFRLAPLLDSTPPVQVAVLQVLTRCVVQHGQRDFWAHRGWPAESDEATLASVRKLPEKLQPWLQPAADQAPPAELTREARRLAAVLQLLPGQPLTGVKVERAEAEMPEGPAAAVLDGVWNSTDLKTMWRYPADKRGSLLFDLGSERIVTGIRIWNWNEPGGVQRGWKEVDVFVSSSPAELAPVATATVLPAPGVADSPDYGVLIPLPAAVGRYVRIQARSNWTLESHSGLAEVQVVGF
ncbi:MAG: hypothetical protein U0935_19725 [Pirellulales bacterium]